MSQLQDRIAQFRNMAMNDPDNELGHYRLGQLLMEAEDYPEAEKSFRRTLELSPQFSKVFQLLGDCLLKQERKEEAIKTLMEGCKVADERGDKMPRDEMVRMLVELGEEPPIEQQPADTTGGTGEGGFPCSAPNCMAGGRAMQLAKLPIPDELGQEIYDKVCAQCWNSWFNDYSIKVINELHLDLSTEAGQDAYDRYMRDYLGLTPVQNEGE